MAYLASALPFATHAVATHSDITTTLGQVGDFFVTVVPYVPIAIAGTIVWLLWLYRVIRSATAPAIVSDFRTTTSVIVPSFHEDPDILMRCLKSWREQNPTEIIIILDVADLDAYERIVALGMTGSARSCSTTPASAPRSALESAPHATNSWYSPTLIRRGRPAS
ncbi:MAG TPA: hypothetical protein VHZ98_10495 [Galbitalea sp.]|jgi:hypothetical protein|nr:hypothetical protein [Galbitalea sp.]